MGSVGKGRKEERELKGMEWGREERVRAEMDRGMETEIRGKGEKMN